MNNADMYYQQQISTAQPAPQQTVASGPITQYPHQLQSNHSYPTAAAAYGGNYYSSLASPHGAGAGSGATAAAVAAAMASGAATVLPLPGVPAGPGAAGGLTGAPGGFPVHDTTGQVAPPGMKPRVTATLWEDEGSLCFQVEARGICVARREDNSMINGTKLLNVAGMTRGRRDGILKSEKTRHVVKIGPMHLKGVWIPFERALDFANKEKITELLYPLFVHNIGALLYHPTNQPRGGSGGVLSAERRRAEQLRSAQSSTPTLPSIGSQQQSQPQAQQQQQHLHHHHHHPSMGMTGPQTPISTHATTRPPLDRAHTFPTPPTPTSATGVIDGGMQSGGYAWPQSAGGSGGISAAVQMDAGAAAAAARSMPATPATTPPSHSISTMPAYATAGAAGQQQPPQQQSQPQQQPYDSARQHMYAHPAATGTQQQQYSAPPGSQDRAAGSMYGQAAATGPAGPYIKNEMAPPSGRPGEPLDPKQDPHDHSAISHHHHHQHQQQQHHHHQQHQQHQHQQHHHHSHHPSDEEHDQHEHDAEYTHNSDPYDSGRAGYNYAAPQVDHHHNPHITSDLTNSPGHASGSGRATPRTAAAPTFYPPTATGYSSPTRAATASAPPSNVYNVINDQASVAAAAVSSAAPADVYAPSPADLAGSVAAGYESAQQPSSLVNGGTSSGLKRGRVEDEDDEEQAHQQQGRPSPNGGMADYGKRRRTIDSTVVTAAAPTGYDTLSRPASAIAAPRSRR